MVKKSVTLLAIFIIAVFLASIVAVYAETPTDDSQKVAKAYDWLGKQVKGKWQTLNIKQHVFSLLALSCNDTYLEPSNASLYAKSFASNTMRCWGRGPAKPGSANDCLLTESALAKVAFDKLRLNSTKIKNWLLSRNTTQVTNINWYLQIDVDRGSNASCEIIYGGNEENMFEVGADKKVSITGSSKCFYIEDVVNEPYWFKIKPQADCYSYSYTIKCFSNATVYRASLLYKKSGSGTWHVSSETKSGKPGVPGSNKLEDQPNPLELKVTSYCLTNPLSTGYCDYEGTAWTAYALKASGDSREANMFVPYLVVFEEDNIGFFPPSFLYPITTQARYSDEILASQKIVGIDKGYWLIQPIVYGRVYDTAHAAIALGASGGEAITKAKNYLLANQEVNGNLVSVNYGESQKESIRDTAFALWALWGGNCPGIGPRGGSCEEQGFDYRCTGNLTCDPTEIPVPFLDCNAGEICCKFIGTGGGEEQCSQAGGSCKEDCNSSEFTIESILTCPDWKWCCKAYDVATCDEIQGEVCDPLQGQTCVGEEVQSLNGSCCLGSCIGGGTSEQNCIDIGIECDLSSVCLNEFTWSEIGFTTTKDSTRCCVGTSAKCVQDKTCSEVGSECTLGEECSGNTVETTDVEDCCEGTCAESCSKLGGDVCTSDEKCSGTIVDSTEGKCCINGECKKSAGLWWIWLIIIIVIIGGGVAYYFLKLKKPAIKKEEKLNLFGGPMGPVSRPVIRPTSQSPATQSKPSLFKPQFRPQQQPRPLMPSSTNKPLVRPSPLKSFRPAPTAPAKTEAKPKGKTESDLEKTLSKLKKMSKK